MSRHVFKLPSLTVSDGGTESNELLASNTYEKSRGIIIFTPETVNGTATLEVSFDGETFVELQSGGSPILLPAGRAVAVDFQGWKSMRVSTSTAQGAERVFTANGVEEMR